MSEEPVVYTASGEEVSSHSGPRVIEAVTTAAAYNELYYYDEPTEQFVTIEEPSAYINDYYTWDDSTKSYRLLSEPSPYMHEETSPYVETYYYDTPSVDLYFYSPKTESYYYIDEPSPFISSYYTWNEATGTYEAFQPESEEFEQPPVREATVFEPSVHEDEDYEEEIEGEEPSI
jgi:hypothetical protein